MANTIPVPPKRGESRCLPPTIHDLLIKWSEAAGLCIDKRVGYNINPDDRRKAAYDT